MGLDFFFFFYYSYSYSIGFSFSFTSMEEILLFPKKGFAEDNAGSLSEYWRDAWIFWEKVGLTLVKVCF